MRPPFSAPLVTTLGVLAAVVLVGWVRPMVPAGAPPATARADQLDYVVVLVNDRPRLVRSGDEVVIVRGDTLRVKDAALIGRDAVKELDVLGLRPHGPSNDDRDVAFKTGELLTRWSEDERGEVFAVLAKTKRQLAGAIYIRLIPPALRYAEVSVNGVRRVLRDGEGLTASAKDLIKIEAVKTNLDATDDVIFQIVPAPERGAAGYEIRFLRGAEIFARIPLILEHG